MKELIKIFADEGDVEIIGPCAGSGLFRVSRVNLANAYGFEIDKRFYKSAGKKC